MPLTGLEPEKIWQEVGLNSTRCLGWRLLGSLKLGFPF